MAKAMLEGFGGPSASYMPQRFYAARSDRECGLMSLLWTVLLTLRWPMMMGIAALGLTISGSIIEPEMALPAVIEHYVPAGIRALVIVPLIAAAMSTFDSTVNGGAAYIVRDLFQGFIRPTASSRELIHLSYLASALIIIVGVIIGFTLPSIHAIWSWITMGLFAGMALPMLLRWYWWRFNGWGFTAGIGAGVLASILQSLFLPSWPIYLSFGIIVLVSLVALLIATFLTSPTGKDVLANFYRHTRPFGFWGMIRNGMEPSSLQGIRNENRRDFSNLFLAIPWQMCLFLTPMYLVVHDFLRGIICLVILALLSVGLYFRWYKALSPKG
jgi:Na+/proline symporter